MEVELLLREGNSKPAVVVNAPEDIMEPDIALATQEETQQQEVVQM